jgi:hypothetical protein
MRVTPTPTSLLFPILSEPHGKPFWTRESFEDLQRLFIADKKFLICWLTHNGAAETCGRATTFRQKMTTSIAENTPFRVSFRLLPLDMTALGLLYRENLTPPSRLGPAAASVQTPPATLAQPPVAPPQLQTNWTFA